MNSQVNNQMNNHANSRSNAPRAADQETPQAPWRQKTAAVTPPAAAETEWENARLRLALREAHHRHGNQWQQLIGLAELESASSPQRAAAGCSVRLRAMMHAFATLNRTLATDRNLLPGSQNVRVRVALESLLALLQTTVEDDALHFAAQDAWLPEKGCAALMLICAELVCNAAKYGRKAIQVTFRVQDQSGILEVRDDGPGFPEGFRVEGQEGQEGQERQGLQLVQTLCRFDLNGAMRCHNEAQGGVVTLIFPVLPAPAAAAVEAGKDFCAMEGIICPENLP